MRLECGTTKLSRCKHLSLLGLDAKLEVLTVGLIKIQMLQGMTTSRLVYIYLQVSIRLPVLTYRLYSEVSHCVHSDIINRLLIIPTKCTVFIHYIHSPSSGRTYVLLT